jgi:hypothetical protein
MTEQVFGAGERELATAVGREEPLWPRSPFQPLANQAP